MGERIFTKCLRCGRPLKNEQSKQRGYGNYCWQLHTTENIKKQKTLFDFVKTIKVGK